MIMTRHFVLIEQRFETVVGRLPELGGQLVVARQLTAAMITRIGVETAGSQLIPWRQQCMQWCVCSYPMVLRSEQRKKKTRSFLQSVPSSDPFPINHMKNMNGYKMILGAAEKMFVRTAPGHTETATISFPNLLFSSPLSNLDYTNIELHD
jgi:hypothetical protein